MSETLPSSPGKVFISYRRATSSWAAWSIYLLLREINKREVWLDLASQKSGKWKENILQNIAACRHFLLILSPGNENGPGTLDRCANPDDILRAEIESAIEKERNIFPVFINEFSWGKEMQRLDHLGIKEQIPFLDHINSLQGRFLTGEEGLEGDIREVNDQYLQGKEEIEEFSLPDENTELTLLSTASSAIPEYLLLEDPGVAVIRPTTDSISASGYVKSTGSYLGLTSKQLSDWIHKNASTVLDEAREVILDEIEYEPGTRQRVASLFVKNIGEKDIESFRGYITSISPLGGTTLWEGDRPLPWLTNGSHLANEITLPPGNSGEIHLASIKDDRRFYVSEVFGEPTFDNNFIIGTWQFTIELRGIIDQRIRKRSLHVKINMSDKENISLHF